VFLSRNLRIPKYALILEKSCKNRAALGVLPQTPVGLRRMGCSPDPVFNTHIYCYNFFYFSVLAVKVLLLSKKNKMCLFLTKIYAVFVGGAKILFAPGRRIP